MNGSPHPAQADGPITPDLLADLQAGLLDDDTAADLRRRVRADPEAAATLAALDRVRRDLAALGAEDASAPPLSPRAARRLAHTLGQVSRRTRARRACLVLGACATLLVIGLGSAKLIRGAGAPPAGVADPRGATLSLLTQAPPATDVGLSEPQLLGLLTAPPDLGPLSDRQRRADCLAALGYPPGLMVLGGRPLQVGDRPGILLLVPDDAPGTVVGLVVPPDCTATDARLLADTSVVRPARPDTARPTVP